MNRLRALLSPPPPAPAVPPEQVPILFRAWRFRQISALFVGYAVFYFVRKNLPVAMPDMNRALGIGTAQLGLFLTLHDLLYGVSKFGNGILADRSNPRYFMAAGLLLSALANLAFGLSSSVAILGLLWLANGWFQGMGFPPCARILSHWVAPPDRGVIWGIWNSSHQVGAALIFVFAGALVSHAGWRAGFVVPALCALVVSAYLANRLRDTPASLGLPAVAESKDPPPSLPAVTGPKQESGSGKQESVGSTRNEDFHSYLQDHVFGNPALWFLCLANLFVYVIRYGVMNWAPMYLSTVRGQSLLHASGSLAGFEMAGLVGALAAGWLRDHAFSGRCAHLAAGYMLACSAALFAFWKLPGGSTFHSAALLLLIGFCIYGPQFLVGLCAASLVGPQAVATAIGLTGLFGYASSAVSGLGFGFLVARSGWDTPFLVMIGGAIAAAVCFLVLAPAERSRRFP